MGRFYGLKNQVLNSHHLIHLADDVRNMECSLSKLTAFPFESFLGKLKKYIRTANKPLVQLCRRVHELKIIKKRVKVTIPPMVEILKEKQGPILGKIVTKFMPPPYNATTFGNLNLLIQKKAPVNFLSVSNWPAYPITLKGQASNCLKIIC